ncbi:tetratricopeptide repeat protein [Pontibacter harenae]|uniref:tetratricopeptide repeat protein n=1 Tax=Pontibacter harenae TaxID=2894083 RepID=UPI001E645FE9|nr:DUF3808 domain-containing protein [Pontibacter harenae]MCC9168321.1 DUF3808 domain-containing protein [Pontibacter harenae]
MAKHHPFFLLLWLLFFSGYNSIAFANSTFTPTLAKAQTELLKLKVINASQLVQQESKNETINAVALLVANYSDFLRICVQQDKSVYDKLINAQEDRLSQLEALKEKSEWVDYSKAEVRMQLGVSKLTTGNKLSAAWDFRKAYLQLKANAETYPQFLPNKKSYGLMQILIGSVPDNYKWFFNIIGMKGSVSAGVANLKSVATQQNPAQKEAQLLYALTQHMLDEEKNTPAALKAVHQLVSEQPDNLLFSFVYIHLLKKTKHSDQALQQFSQRPKGKGYLSFPYLHHMAADLYLYKGDYSKSIEANKIFLEQHQGEHYLKSAYYKLFLAYKLNNLQPQAKWYYNNIAPIGIAETEEDKYASRFIERKEQFHNALLVARLRYDGGYYKKALQVLNNIDNTDELSSALNAEYLYRKARIYHGLNNKPLAIFFYQKTIKACEATDLYFAPNAALQLGYLYQQSKQPSMAKAYFDKAKSFKGHAYKNSIDAKAKLALSTL